MPDYLSYRDFCAQVSREIRENGVTTQSGERFRVQDVVAVMDTFLDRIVQHLVSHPDQQIRLSGLGSFLLVQSLADRRKNNLTGKVIDVPDKHYLKFKAFRRVQLLVQELIDERDEAIRETDGNAFLDGSGLDDEEEE